MLNRIRVLGRRIGGLLSRRRLDEEFQQELDSHLEMLIEENLRRGMPPEEARRTARVQLGGITQLRETQREMWGLPWLESFLQDLSYGLRQLRRNPGFTAVAVLTLALGIGANTAIFSVINAVMLKTLPVKNPKQLVLMSWVSQKVPAGLFEITDQMRHDAAGRSTGLAFPYTSFEQFKKGRRLFSTFFGFRSTTRVNANAGGQANLAYAQLVTGNYFSGLGVTPILGRAITRVDENAEAPSVAVISYGFWSRYFGSDRAAVGKDIVINGVPFTVIGVAPSQFFGVRPGLAVDIWVPIVQDARLIPWGAVHPAGEISPFTSRTSWWVDMMGRLKPGVTARQAEAQLEVLFQQSRAGEDVAAKPQSIPHVHLESGAKGLSSLRERYSTPLWILTMIVGIVLLIACANIAALLVARSAARQQEIALRRSLGASRARLVRQLLTESVLLAGMGGAAGVLFAHWASRALVLLMSSGGQPLNLVVQLDARVLGFTAAVSIMTGILFGLAPALRSTRLDLTPALKTGMGGTPFLGRRGRLGLAGPLVATQVAMALMLAIGAGLFVRTLEALEGQSLGFNQQHLLLFRIDPTQNGYEGGRLMDFFARLQARLDTLPGVESATMSMEPPVYGDTFHVTVPVSIDGRKPKPSTRADWNTVGPSFFKTLGIPLLMGRGIEPRDTATSPRVVVINKAFARDVLGGRSPLGHTVRFPFPLRSNPEFKIVGIVQDTRYARLRDTPRPTIYIPYTQLLEFLGQLNFEMRTTGAPLTMVPMVRRAVQDLDPDLPISDVRTQAQQIDETLMQERLFGRLSSFFGGLAVLLACVGLFGVISYSVSQRTHEIGIRMALGAEKSDVLKMVIAQGLKLALIGVAIGIAGALALTRFLSSLLYGVKPTDPLTFIAVSLILIAVALVACFIPARRAAKVDPMVALRYE